MASNSLPTNASQLIGLGTKMNQGLTSLGSTLKITQITPAAFAAKLNAFIAADGDFNAARSARQSASDAFKPTDAALSTWLQTTRNILAGRFGSRWSTMWAQAGFVNASTSVAGRNTLPFRQQRVVRPDPKAHENPSSRAGGSQRLTPSLPIVELEFEGQSDLPVSL